MAPARSIRRGGPLVALVAIMASWAAGRVVAVGLAPQPGDGAVPVIGQGEIVRLAAPLPATSQPPAIAKPVPVPPRVGAPQWAPPNSGPMAEPLRAPIAAPAPYRPVPIRPVAAAPVAPLPVSAAAGHQIMWLSALSRLPLPAGLVAPRQAAPPQLAPLPAPFTPALPAPGRAGRWSGDGWLMLRQGSGGALTAGATPAAYGASQAGAVLRYRLAPARKLAPQAYVRLAAALNAPADKELAAGLSARPLVRVPLRAMAELRVSEQSGQTRLRPAALVVTEIRPIDLPHQVRAEFYGQAGYVSGRNATAFADGQARLDKQVATLGKAQLRAGAGVWGGAQKGAARLDLGPSATLGVPMGEGGSARLGLDYRIRAAGEARPGSGLALTLSAGF
jgi:hypothetical protein